jgi:hypothetical protein
VAAARSKRVEQRLTKQQQEDDLALNADDPTTTDRLSTVVTARAERASETETERERRVRQKSLKGLGISEINEPF